MVSRGKLLGVGFFVFAGVHGGQAMVMFVQTSIKTSVILCYDKKGKGRH